MKRILVIDDEADIREIVRISLKITKQWDVLTAASGQEGVTIAAALQPDAILLDVTMPELDGMATLQQLKQNPQTQKIPVLLLTATPQATAQQSFLALEAKAVLPKPFDPGLLGSQIAAVLSWE